MSVIKPDFPEMTIGDMKALFPVLASWAAQHQSVEGSFDIWGWPGMSLQWKLGKGHNLLEA